MAGRTLVLVTTVALLSGAFAGCLSETPKADPDYSLNRQVRFHVDDGNVDEMDELDGPGLYDFVESAFVVTVRKAETSPASLAISYRDRTGADVERPLTDFTTKPLLVPGDSVRVEDADLTSHAVLKKDGAVVASRVLADPSWWNVQGVPVGFELEPGAVLSYDVTGGFDETATLHDVRIKEPAIHIDSMTAAVHVKQDTTGRLDFTGAEETVTSMKTQQARPLAWAFDGEVRLPMTFEFVGTDAENGEAIAAGVEVLPETGVEFDAKGKLWIAGSGQAVLGEVDGGSFATKADIIAWATGIEEASEFSCNGKTRADACRPTEWELDEFEMSEEIPASKENLDQDMGETPSEMVDNLTRFFAEDMQPGDEIVFDMHVTDSSDFGLPDGAVLDWSAQIKAVGIEQVTVKAGTFDALKVIEQVRIDSRVPGIGEAPLAIEQTLLEATFWFEPVTFVPLRFEYVVPFNVGQVAGALIDAAGDEFWEEAPIERFDPKDLNVVTESRFAFELAEKKGEARFSPWMTLVGAQYVGGTPAMAFAAASYVWVSGFGTSGTIQKFPQIVLRDAAGTPGPQATDALASLEHRGGDYIGWYEYDLNVFRNGQETQVGWSTDPSCDFAPAEAYSAFGVGDRIFVCPHASDDGMVDEIDVPQVSTWAVGDELKVQIVDMTQNTIVYENTIILAEGGSPNESVGHGGGGGGGSGEWTPPHEEVQVSEDFVITGFDVTPTSLHVGEFVTGTVGVLNAGDEPGFAFVILVVDGAQRATQGVHLEAGEEIPVSFDFMPSEPGTLTLWVQLGEQTSDEVTITVEE